MTGNYFTNPLIFLIHTLFGIYIAIVLIRFLLQWARADFYNPISQFIVRVTTPVLRPLRQIIPGLGGLDIASLVLAWALKSIELALLAAIVGAGAQALWALAWAIPALISLLLDILLIAILIHALLSWVSPDPYNPAVSLLRELTAPILRPLRQALPDFGGLDISPMAAIIAIVLLKMLVVPPIEALTGSLSTRVGLGL